MSVGDRFERVGVWYSDIVAYERFGGDGCGIARGRAGASIVLLADEVLVLL